MKERVVIIFLAVVFGLLVSTLAFYLYQSAKTIKPQNIVNKINKSQIVETNQNNNKDTYLTVNEPKNESISDNRTIVVEGKTNSVNIVIVSSNLEDIILTPNSNDDFSGNVDIDTGANKIIIRAITPDGTELIEEKIITYSTEEF